MNRILPGAVSACAALAFFTTAAAFGHPPGELTHHAPVLASALVPAENAVPAASEADVKPIISGSGQFRYQYDPARLQLPAGVKIKHGHGLCHDQQGNIYFTFEPEAVQEATRALIRFNPDGTGATLLGKDNALAKGVPHGLSIHTEPDGKQVLYHANNSGTVHKTGLDGEIIWTRAWGPEMGNYKPTETAASPGERLIVADGYGSSMVHVLKTSDGVYAGKSWGGAGASHGELNCPHGVTLDPRRGLLLVADRGNKRLEYFEMSGKYHSTITAPEIQAPCNADVHGDHVMVPNLDGPLVILDKDNRTVSVIEVGKLLGDRGFKHPHDAIWLPNGDIVVCTWNPGRLAYWKRAPLIAK